MADRHHGYDVSLAYPSYFIREMAPNWLDFCMQAHGFEAPLEGSSYRYLDLGCGQGFHLCVLAAANPDAEFVGIDFDPAYIAHGQQIASTGGLENVRFVQADFLDLAVQWPTDLGAFDYIALQGILSWVSPQLRAAALQCVAGASKPGSVASFGYNTLPGWIGAMPFQHIASEFNKSAEANEALGRAIGMFRRLRDVKAPAFDQMPRFKKQLDVFTAQPAGYLAHEFLPEYWTPLWHSAVARDLRKIDFTYVGSAAVAEALLPDALAPELRAVILDEPDDVIRQDVQDIVIMQQFRRDIFCRRPRRGESSTLTAETPIYLLSAPPENAPIHLKTTFGAAAVDYDSVADIVEAVADGPRSFGELMALQNPARQNSRSVLLSMLEGQMLGVGTGKPGSNEVARRFNAKVARAVAHGMAYRNLASATLGTGIVANEGDMLMLDAWLSGKEESDPGNLAKGVAQRLRKLERQLQFRGAVIPDDQLESHVVPLAKAFIQEKLAQWRSLGIL